MKHTYLKSYNLILAISWSLFLLRMITTGFQLDPIALLLLNISQGAAILEILHVSVKWVRSPVFTTTIQVASRIFVLVLINIIPSADWLTIYGVNGVHVVTVAWSVTEIVRYSFYFLTLLGKQPTFLTFLRYSLFIVLYPIGVAGEWMIILSQMKSTGWELSIINIALGVIMLAYLYFFPQLYGYMFKQRRSKVGG